MIGTGITSTQLVYIAFAIYANYQFFKWIFCTVKAVAFSDFTNDLIRRLTPRSVIQKRIRLEKLRRIENQRQKEKDHQDALESHRKYQYTGWWNIGFIEEDRATLFKGYEDIKWQWGSQRIDRTKLYTPDDSIKLAYMVFLEISIYRQAFIEKAKWTPAMEVFWRKILPKQFNLENQRPEVGLKEQGDVDKEKADLEMRRLGLEKDLAGLKNTSFSWQDVSKQAQKVQEVMLEKDPVALKNAMHILFKAIEIGPEDKMGFRTLKYILNDEFDPNEDEVRLSSQMVEVM